jgi:anti-sigma regulatory factor (Ser/Thr protein kinase)
MPESIRFLIDESSKTAEARRFARSLAAGMGLGEILSEQVSIVVTEACTNLLKHAERGELIMHSAMEGPGPVPFLEVLALDHGPGIEDLERCLQNGYSTSGTLGHGLGAIIRLSKDTDFYSIPGKGTGILARWWSETRNEAPPSPLARGGFRISAVNVPKTGQETSGDSWGSVQSGDQLTVLVADGLGHGLEANAASSQAVRILRENPNLAPQALLERCHLALRSTRGAAVAVAQIDLAREKLTFAGAGNISARIHSSNRPGQHLVSVNGTAGHQTERLREFCYPWPRDGMLQLHSDGLSSGAGVDGYPGLAARDPALIAGVLFRDFARGRDDATVVVAKAA